MQNMVLKVLKDVVRIFRPSEIVSVLIQQQISEQAAFPLLHSLQCIDCKKVMRTATVGSSKDSD